MTGSSLAPIIIPIVVSASLAAWLVMVYHAASHPQWNTSRARRHAESQPVVLADRRQPGPVPAPDRRAA
jgi:hypothetical protein